MDYFKTPAPVTPTPVFMGRMPNAFIAQVIEHWVATQQSFMSIAKIYGISDGTVGSYIKRYYLGKTKGQTKVITLQSSINEPG